MVSKIAIAMTTVIAITVGSTMGASAMHGGGGMGHGGGGMGMGHGGMGGWHGGSGHSGFSPGFHQGFRHDRDDRFAFRHDRDDHFRFRRDHDRDDRFRFRHRFFRDDFAFLGAPYDYSDDCYTRVWTRWGWRVRSVCY
jgi:hypothetical protein